MESPRPVRVFSLTFAEDAYQNAQQLNVRELASRLDPSRFEIALLSDGSGPATILDRSNVRALRVPRRGRALRILLRLLAGGFDVLIHPHVGWAEAVYLRLPRWWPSRRRARVLVSVEGDLAQLDEVPRGVRERLESVYRRADAVFPITDHVAATLKARTGRGGPVVPVGVDLEIFHPRDPRSDSARPLRVLCVGKVKDWKRPELARLAAERLPDLEFTWIGDGERLASERAQAPPNLSLQGQVDHRTLPDVYRGSDVFLHPSRMEGLPKVMLEALASGLPVVAFADYDPRFVTEAGAGFVVRDGEAMIAALRRLADDPELRAQMSARARAAAEKFGWDAVTRRWEEIFLDEAARVHGEAGSGGPA
jgi:glycogen(starch) synthase